jgi:hypothetical protein
MNTPSLPGFRQALVRASARSRLAVLAVLLLFGCADGSSAFPPFRSLGWFRYLDGADIRKNCGVLAGDRYRLVYNAIWGEQVRDYEIATEATGGQLSVRVIFPEYLNILDLRDPLASFRGRSSTLAPTQADLGELAETLRQSGFYEPAPKGLTLPSDGFYWIVAACERGVFHYNAYAYPSPRFDGIRFDRWLFAHDGAGVPVNPPRPTPPRPTNLHVTEENQYSFFDLQVGDGGLLGIP